MDISHTYNVTLQWTAGRQGRLASPELTDTVEVATPPPFPQGIEGTWSPEHLLVASVSSCLMTTFLAIAENSKLAFVSYADKAVGKLENVDGKLAVSEILLQPEIGIQSEADQERALRILQKSEANCLISRSVRSRIEMKPVIRVVAPVTA
jgi:peroxiredoxin-like protein